MVVIFPAALRPPTAITGTVSIVAHLHTLPTGDNTSLNSRLARRHERIHKPIQATDLTATMTLRLFLSTVLAHCSQLLALD